MRISIRCSTLTSLVSFMWFQTVEVIITLIVLILDHCWIHSAWIGEGWAAAWLKLSLPTLRLIWNRQRLLMWMHLISRLNLILSSIIQNLWSRRKIGILQWVVSNRSRRFIMLMIAIRWPRIQILSKILIIGLMTSLVHYIHLLLRLLQISLRLLALIDVLNTLYALQTSAAFLQHVRFGLYMPVAFIVVVGIAIINGIFSIFYVLVVRLLLGSLIRFGHYLI